MTEEPDDAERRKPAKQDSRAAAAARIQQQQTWVDLQLRRAVERGDFDDLPGYGKPLELTSQHDPDWWIKQLVERERIVVLPPSLQLRKEDAELDGQLDALATEAQVRRAVEEFNARVRWALYRPPEGPPMITRSRDVEAEVERWRHRRQVRREERRAALEAAAAEQENSRRRWSLRRLWRRTP